MSMSAEQTLLSEPRIIGQYSSNEPGPLVLAVGGIHGNEPSGPRAIEKVLSRLQETRPRMSGTFAGLIGNRRALAENRRCIQEDLNRCFFPDRIAQIDRGGFRSCEEIELREIVAAIELLADGVEDIFYVDCHTTSAATVPYISVNNHTESLHLSRMFPLHNVIGLETSIPGCFGEYCNRQDYHGFTVESGQHQEPSSVVKHEAIIWLMLVFSGVILKQDVGGFSYYLELLSRDYTETRKNFRLTAHYRITPGEEFVMQPGFCNFSRVEKGQLLAINKFGAIRSPQEGRILMPLYQKEGDDGFFLLEEE